eukprot:m.309769 g.309769  ORF g.309769 m.309769 type:complete len:1074 (+) comp47698_c0_seq1:27-3248(+)
MAAAENPLSWDSIAEHLLANHLVLSALELHLELVEFGKELPVLRDFFSNPGNFERPIQLQGLSRSASISTFDSFDVSRYSDDGRDEDDKIAVLEYELRKANETIKKLRGSLTSAAENHHDVTTLSSEDKQREDNDAIKPYEKRALNFLINEFLMKNGHKLTSVTFSDEIADQDLDDWDNVGLNTPQPPDLLHLYRDFGNHLIPQLVDDEKRQLLEKRLSSLESELVAVKRENEMMNRHLKQSESQLIAAKQELDTRDREIKHIKGVMELANVSNEETATDGKEEAQEMAAGQVAHHEDSTDQLVLSETVPTEDDNTETASDVETPSVEEHPVQADTQRRQMSTAFRQNLLSVKVVLDSRLGQEVAKLEDPDETPVLVFGRCLHHIYPNVILAKRDELIPVLLCTIKHHPDADSRDRLLHVMFNLIKRPNQEQRQMIMSGCVAFAKHNGPTMVEAELMPQCWEQINHKYVERRLLVAESCGSLAPYLPSELRSSLVLSMLQQMLCGDKSEEVREAAISSLAIIVAFIDDRDKYSQCNELLLTALRDSASSVALAGRRVFLPAFMAWSFELHWLETKLISGLLQDLKKTVEHSLSKVETDAESVILEKIELLTETIPWQVSSLMLKAPLTDWEQTSAKPVTYPRVKSPLFDMSVIVGSKERLASLHSSFNSHIQESSLQMWPELQWFKEEYLPQFRSLVELVDLSMEKTLQALRHYANVLCRTIGHTFSSKLIKPYFLSQLAVEENKESALAEGSGYTNGILPFYVAGILAAFRQDQGELVTFLCNTITMLAMHCIPIDSLKAAFAELSLDPFYHEPLIGILWDLLVEPAFHVRCCAATLFECLVRGVNLDLVSKRVVPALVTLASDGEMLVRQCTLSAFGCIAETVTDRTLLEKIRLQFQSFLGDPIYEDQHSVQLEVVKTLSDIGPNVEPLFRDEFVLPRLADIAAKNNSITNETRRRDIALELLEGFKALSCCFFSIELLEKFMIPGLKSVLTDVNDLELPDKGVITKLVSECQSKIDEKQKSSESGEKDEKQSSSFFKKFRPSLDLRLTPRSRSQSKRKALDLFRRKGKDS